MSRNAVMNQDPEVEEPPVYKPKTVSITLEITDSGFKATPVEPPSPPLYPTDKVVWTVKNGPGAAANKKATINLPRVSKFSEKDCPGGDFQVEWAISKLLSTGALDPVLDGTDPDPSNKALIRVGYTLNLEDQGAFVTSSPLTPDDQPHLVIDTSGPPPHHHNPHPGRNGDHDHRRGKG